jgi:hypothetical protein
LLVQTAWILAVPPFRGIDEFDQAYRSAGVAGGEWRAEGIPKDGRGGLVTVPADIVKAANRQCEALKYTKPDNCNPAQVLPDGRVRVASAASRYHPAFYWVVGTAARPFNGATALYVMRAVAALLCALGLAVAAWCATRNRSSRWPLVGFLVAFTPVFAYSTVMPAPNGLEMVAGLLLWCALLSLEERPRTGDGLLLGFAIAASVCLVSMRSLGPVLALLVVGCAMIVRRRELPDIWRAHTRGIVAGVVLTAVATAGSIWWILAQAPLGTSDGDNSNTPYSVILRNFPMELLQSVAAFPLRNEAAPAFVYVAYAAVLLVFLVAAVRCSRGTVRQGLVLALVLSQLVPLVLTLVTFRSAGVVWQGRYGLPFVSGIAVLAGLALERAKVRLLGRMRLTAAIAGTLYVAAQVTSIGAVYHRELGNAVSTNDPGFVQTSTLLVVAIAAIGWLVMLMTLLVGVERRGADSDGLRKADHPVVAA